MRTPPLRSLSIRVFVRKHPLVYEIRSLLISYISFLFHTTHYELNVLLLNAVVFSGARQRAGRSLIPFFGQGFRLASRQGLWRNLREGEPYRWEIHRRTLGPCLSCKWFSQGLGARLLLWRRFVRSWGQVRRWHIPWFWGWHGERHFRFGCEGVVWQERSRVLLRFALWGKDGLWSVLLWFSYRQQASDPFWWFRKTIEKETSAGFPGQKDEGIFVIPA